jgi:hypothetical protein
MFRTALANLLARIRHRRRTVAADRAARVADDLDRQPPISILMHVRAFLSLVREILLARESHTGRRGAKTPARGAEPPTEPRPRRAGENDNRPRS